MFLFFFEDIPLSTASIAMLLNMVKQFQKGSKTT